MHACPSTHQHHLPYFCLASSIGPSTCPLWQPLLQRFRTGIDSSACASAQRCFSVCCSWPHLSSSAFPLSVAFYLIPFHRFLISLLIHLSSHKLLSVGFFFFTLPFIFRYYFSHMRCILYFWRPLEQIFIDKMGMDLFPNATHTVSSAKGQEIYVHYDAEMRQVWHSPYSRL